MSLHVASVAQIFIEICLFYSVLLAGYCVMNHQPGINLKPTELLFTTEYMETRYAMLYTNFADAQLYYTQSP